MEENKDIIMDKIHECKACQWQGKESELEFDETETCFGTEKIEMCPSCGSYEIEEKRK